MSNDDYSNGDDPQWENRKRREPFPKEQDDEKTGFRWWVIALFIAMLAAVVFFVKPARAESHDTLVLGKEVVLVNSWTCAQIEHAETLMSLVDYDLPGTLEIFNALVKLRRCNYGVVVLTPIEIVGAYTDVVGNTWLVIRSETVQFNNLPIIYLMTVREIVFGEPSEPSPPIPGPTSFGERDA